MAFNLGQLFANVSGTPGTAPAAAPQPAAPTVPGTGGMPAAAPNPGADPANVQDATGLPASAAPTEPSSPLDAFKEIFTIDPNKPAPQNPLAEKLFTMDPAKMAESVSKMNFTQNLTAEQLQTAMQSPQEMQKILNQVAQNSFAMSLQMVTGMMESGFNKNNQRFESVLSDRIRTTQMGFEAPKNPALNHPAAQPVLGAMKATIAQQFPQLSPAQVTQKAEEYFQAMASALTASDPSKPAPKQEAGDIDWLSTFLDEPGK